MWIPYTDSVVVVTCDPIAEGEPAPAAPPLRYNLAHQLRTFKTALGLVPATKAPAERPLRDLLIKTSAEKGGRALSKKDVEGMSFAQLRDALLALAPLDKV